MVDVVITRYPQRWSVVRPQPPTRDPVTGNEVPAPPIFDSVRGLLSQRFIETEQTTLTDRSTAGTLVLQLDASLPGGLSAADRVRFDGDSRTADSTDGSGLVTVGDVLRIQGEPRVRRPALGGPPAYIVAIVRHTSDIR